jgi:hypothetical protein
VALLREREEHTIPLRVYRKMLHCSFYARAGGKAFWKNKNASPLSYRLINGSDIRHFCGHNGTHSYLSPQNEPKRWLLTKTKPPQLIQSLLAYSFHPPWFKLR